MRSILVLFSLFAFLSLQPVTADAVPRAKSGTRSVVKKGGVKHASFTTHAAGKKGNRLHVELKARGNKEPVLSSQTYTSQTALVNGVVSIVQNVENDKRIRFAPSGKTFSVLAENGQVVGTSETYSSKSAAKAGLAAVRKNVNDAAIAVFTGSFQKQVKAAVSRAVREGRRLVSRR